MKPPSTSQLEDINSKAHISILSLGLGTFFASLLIYAGTVTAFLRYEGITVFVSTFAHTALTSLLITSIVLALIMFKGYSLPPRMVMGAGSILYALSAACFSYLALTSTNDALPLYFGSVACGIGDCFLCLVWGKIFGRFSLRSALLNVAIACIIAAGVYCAVITLPPLAGVGLFMTCTLFAIIVPLLTKQTELANENKLPSTAHNPSANLVDAPTTLRGLASFADVITRPAVGLFVFAYVMGLTCYTFVDIFETYLASSVLAAFVLGILAFLRLRRPLTRLLFRDLIPLLAITTLAIPTITTALVGESFVSMFFTLLLYTFTAFLTVSTLCAIAHASEFSSDFIFVTALALFAIASIAGLITSEMIEPVMANVIVIVVTTLYAFAMVVTRDLDSRNTTDNAIDDSSLSLSERRHNAEHQQVNLAQRCTELAAQYGLTAREDEILRYLAEGHNGAYISEILFISPNTVRTHIHNIYCKLKISSREDILRLTKETDEVPPQVQR